MMRSRFVLVYSNKSDAAAGLVDLPHVQLLVLFQGLLELGGGEAAGDAALLCFSHAHHAAGSGAACHALRGELAHQREDDVRRPLSPEQKNQVLIKHWAEKQTARLCTFVFGFTKSKVTRMLRFLKN